jgi:hypothetical protein
MELIAEHLGFPADVAVPTDGNRNYFKKAWFHIAKLLRASPPPRALPAVADVEPPPEAG